MEHDSENFDQLRRLLVIKKHEQPPSGYFNRFPGEVMARIREEQRAHAKSSSRLNADVPWLLRIWQSLTGEPAFAGVFGAVVCALLLAGIFFAETPGTKVPVTPVSPAHQNPPVIAASPENSVGGLGLPVLMTSTNPAENGEPNLFNLIPAGQTAPVSFNPPGQ